MKNKINQTLTPTLNEAPSSVQLAVDLIQLLEYNNVDNQIAIDALEIVLNDFRNKQNMIAN